MTLIHPRLIGPPTRSFHLSFHLHPTL